MKLQSSFAVPATLVAVAFALSCSDPATTTRPETGGTGGGGTGGVGAGGTGGTAGGGTGGTAGGGTGGTAGGGAGGTGGTGGTAGGGAGGTGGAGGSGGGTPLPATFANLKSVIQMSCFGGVCHDFELNPLQLSVNDQLYTRLTTHETENCGPLLTPGNPAMSALVTLIKGSCGGTDRMPYGDCYDEPEGGSICLSPAVIKSIEDWVTAGAPQQ